MVIMNYLVTLLLLPIAVIGLSEYDVKESTCSKIQSKLDKEPINSNLKWMESIETWYVPMWSKLHAYRMANDFLNESMADISEDRLGSSCILINKNNIISAYGKEIKFEIQRISSSLTFKGTRRGSKSSNFSFKLTDNLSYIFGISCWEDDQISWAVLSTTPTLRFSVKNLVLDYVKALGLKKALALEEDYGYGSCKGAHNKKEL